MHIKRCLCVALSCTHRRSLAVLRAGAEAEEEEEEAAAAAAAAAAVGPAALWQGHHTVGLMRVLRGIVALLIHPQRWCQRRRCSRERACDAFTSRAAAKACALTWASSPPRPCLSSPPPLPVLTEDEEEEEEQEQEQEHRTGARAHQQQPRYLV